MSIITLERTNFKPKKRTYLWYYSTTNQTKFNLKSEITMNTNTNISKQQQVANLIQADLSKQGLSEGVVVRATQKEYMEKISINPINKSPSDIKAIEMIADKYRFKEGRSEGDLKIEYIFITPSYNDNMRQKALDAMMNTHDLPQVSLSEVSTFMNINGEPVNVMKKVAEIIRGIDAEVDMWTEEATA